ncbi:MAG: PorV/PorQ family protein, partial [Elusimicrobia bacterium]|nr:PorV/PorQ family protein [Elusimicrobiota bacterium]
PSDAGTSTAQFLKLGAGAKESGMGSAQVAASSDANAVYWNPAGLNGVQDMSVSFMHVNWLEDITYDWLGFAKRINTVGVFGFGVQYMGYGSIKETNEVGVHVGDFTPNDTAVTFSYARKISDIEFGGSAKYISSRIKRSADSVAFDAGARYKLKDIKLTLGAVATNVGPGLKYVSEESPLPLMIKVGCWYEISNNVWSGSKIQGVQDRLFV